MAEINLRDVKTVNPKQLELVYKNIPGWSPRAVLLNVPCTDQLVFAPNAGTRFDSCTVEISSADSGSGYGEVREGEPFQLSAPKPGSVCQVRVYSCTFWAPNAEDAVKK